MKKNHLGSDHVGFKMKYTVSNNLITHGYEIIDFVVYILKIIGQLQSVMQ